MHQKGYETTGVGGDHFRSTSVKLWAAVEMEAQQPRIPTNHDVATKVVNSFQ